MYLTFDQVFTRMQDEIDCRIQRRPLPYHLSTKYALDHIPPPLQAPYPIQSVQPPLKHPTPPILAASVHRPVTKCVPTPKIDSSISHLQLLAPHKPTPNEYPITGSPVIRRLMDFNVHKYICFRHLRDYTALHRVCFGVNVVLQGEPPLPPLT
jgi:hypothetical protein